MSNSKSIVKFADIRWATVTSFYEERENTKVYGFTIFFGSEKIYFYVENERNLNDWRESISKVGVISEFSNDFVVIKKLGSGKFGQVYLVRNLLTHKEFAMKSIEKLQTFSSAEIDSIISEIQILRKIDHPSITKLHRVYESKKHIKLVLDYCPFGTLLSRIQLRKKFCEKTTKALARNLFRAVQYLHSNQLIHRDIKLENIFMISENDDTQIKLGDFGLACYINETQDKKSGSPGYIAPEILLNKKYNEKIDIFSCGTVIYTLLSGTFPFEGNSFNQILFSNYKCKISFEEMIWEKLSYSAINFTSKLLEVNPDLRPSINSVLDMEWINNAGLKARSPITNGSMNEIAEDTKKVKIA